MMGGMLGTAGGPWGMAAGAGIGAVLSGGVYSLASLTHKELETPDFTSIDSLMSNAKKMEQGSSTATNYNNSTSINIENFYGDEEKFNNLVVQSQNQQVRGMG